MGILNQMTITKVHEGSNSRIFRNDGTQGTARPNYISGSFSYELSDIKDMTIEDVFRNIDDATEEFVAKLIDHVMNEIGTVCEETGNVLNLNNKKFTAVYYLELLEKLEIRFDCNGDPVLPDALVGASLDPKAIKEEMQKTQKDETLRKRFAEIISKKREEHNAREGNRELVR
ncbi:MAG: hypothetical protein OXC39_03775 [Candidatus Dadabacteria bacterium]|nr:hypothetical protein [Candidatus Dadabacteria bacterium]